MKEICLDILCGLSVILVAVAISASAIGIAYLVRTYTGEVIYALGGLLVIRFLYVIGHDIRNT